jgi:hypothetical protein
LSITRRRTWLLLYPLGDRINRRSGVTRSV